MSYTLSAPTLVWSAADHGKLPPLSRNYAPSLPRSPRSASERRDLVCNALIEAHEAHREANADGYGSAPSQSGSFSLALYLVERLPPSVPDPEVCVDPDGEVSLDWFMAPRQTFSVSVGADGILRYAALLGGEQRSGRVRFDGETVPPEVVSLARRAMRPL